MEARKAFRGSVVSTGTMVALVAVLAAFMLGGIGGYVVKALSRPVSAVTAHVVTVTTAPSEFGSAWNYRVRRGGTQSVEGPPPAMLPAVEPRESSPWRSGPQS